LDPKLRNLRTAIEENVLAQAENLKSHPAVYAAMREGRIDIFGWVYHFETGDVTIYDPATRKFQLSTEIAERSAVDLKSFSL
jgi:carbonic anhydrase